MNFCSQCDNMYYIRLSGVSETTIDGDKTAADTEEVKIQDKLVYYCRNCGNEDTNLNVDEIASKTGNIYKSVRVIGKRARQLSATQKEELNEKLAEFASDVDNLEEVFENREQIENLNTTAIKTL